MKPDPAYITLGKNAPRIEEMLTELILRPRRDLAKWATLTKQTPNVKIGYPGQHFASLVTGVEGERTGARGHDLRDKSEVKSCSRIDQLDKCKNGNCRAAVARIEDKCPRCGSTDVKRNNDSKWLIGVKSEEELEFLLDEVPRVVFIIGDYPNYDSADWETLRFQVFEIWPSYKRHENFRILMENYYRNIYLRHIEENPNKTPAPKNFWPYSFQFYMCNPVRIFHCIVKDALGALRFDENEMEYTAPTTNRAMVEPLPMPISLLTEKEKTSIRQNFSDSEYIAAEANGLNEEQRLTLNLRDTDHASPQTRSYERGVR